MICCMMYMIRRLQYFVHLVSRVGFLWLFYHSHMVNQLNTALYSIGWRQWHYRWARFRSGLLLFCSTPMLDNSIPVNIAWCYSVSLLTFSLTGYCVIWSRNRAYITFDLETQKGIIIIRSPQILIRSCNTEVYALCSPRSTI